MSRCRPFQIVEVLKDFAIFSDEQSLSLDYEFILQPHFQVLFHFCLLVLRLRCLLVFAFFKILASFLVLGLILLCVVAYFALFYFVSSRSEKYSVCLSNDILQCVYIFSGICLPEARQI